MVQSVSTSGNIAAALMAAAREREEMRRRMEAEQAAANARMRPENPDAGGQGATAGTQGQGQGQRLSFEELAELDPSIALNAQPPPLTPEEKEFRKYLEGYQEGKKAAPETGLDDKKRKRGPNQRELQERRYGKGGVKGELERREKAKQARDEETAKSNIKRDERRARREARATGYPYGRSYEMLEELGAVREQGGQAAVDEFLRKQFPEFAEIQDSGMKTNPTQAERKADMRRDANRRANNARDFRETFGQDASSLRNRFGADAPRLMRDRMMLAESRVPSYDMGNVMPEGFHRLDPDIQRLRVRRGQEAGRFTDADMAGLLDGGDVREITGKPRMAMQGALGQETPFEQSLRLSEQGRAEEMERVYDAGGTMGNANQQGFGRPEDAATRRGTFFRPNVFGAAAEGLGDYFQDPIGTTVDFYDRNVVNPARDFFGDILDRLLPR